MLSKWLLVFPPALFGYCSIAKRAALLASGDANQKGLKPSEGIEPSAYCFMVFR